MVIQLFNYIFVCIHFKLNVIMKKLVLLILTLGLFSFFPMSTENLKTKTSVKKIEKVANSDCKYGQCEATAKSTKKRCKHCVSEQGDTYCWQHK